MSFTVGIIGGGVAGSTIAIKLSEAGINSVLFEGGPSLVNGPPMCHLHAGGALYREIPTEHCIKMLKESIDTLKCYKYSANVRPTLLTVPIRDSGQPQDIIKRLTILTQKYRQMIQEDKNNAVLGRPQDYFRVFSREQVQKLRQIDIPQYPQTVEDWLITPAKNLDLEKFKFPFIMVQEYGLSSLRTSAFANLALEKSRNCQTLKNTKVTKIKKTLKNRWEIFYEKKDGRLGQTTVDYLVNACGYKTGVIDDMAGYKKKRMLQFKAAYITQWHQCKGLWPEVIIHGKRRTPQGMAQLTPYAGNFFQIHGMTQDITLFKDALVESNDQSSQPKFTQKINDILTNGWEEEQAVQRTKNAVEFVSYFIPAFRSAIQTKKPLYGAQQIPGSDPSLRASEMSYEQGNYARAEIVKASTAISVAKLFIQKLKSTLNVIPTVQGQQFESIQRQQVVERAKKLAKQRNYPTQIAQFYYKNN